MLNYSICIQKSVIGYPWNYLFTVAINSTTLKHICWMGFRSGSVVKNPPAMQEGCGK